MTDSVTVEQCDREAAARYDTSYRSLSALDVDELAEAFARHRIAERKRIQDAIIALLDDLPTGSIKAHAMRQCLKATEPKP